MPSKLSMGTEPVAIITAADIGLQAVQQSTLHVSSYVHLAIAIALVVLNGILARAVVTPVAKPATPPPSK